METLLDGVFVFAALASAFAAVIAALRAGRAEKSVHHMTVSVNGRLDELLAGARAGGLVQGREDERADRAEDEEGAL